MRQVRCAICRNGTDRVDHRRAYVIEAESRRVLAFAADMGAGHQEDVALSESEELRKTETGLNGEQQ
jgi:hypothetical protein